MIFFFFLYCHLYTQRQNESFQIREGRDEEHPIHCEVTGKGVRKCGGEKSAKHVGRESWW